MRSATGKPQPAAAVEAVAVTVRFTEVYGALTWTTGAASITPGPQTHLHQTDHPHSCPDQSTHMLSFTWMDVFTLYRPNDWVRNSQHKHNLKKYYHKIKLIFPYIYIVFYLCILNDQWILYLDRHFRKHFFAKTCF